MNRNPLYFLSVNLEAIRVMKRLSQVQFAKHLGITPTYYNQLKACTNANPSFEMLVKIAERCEVDFSDLFLDPQKAHARLTPTLLTEVAERFAKELEKEYRAKKPKK